MATRVRISQGGVSLVHFSHGRGVDYTLCGLNNDEFGDEEIVLSGATTTNRKVDCEDCISIVNFCKSVKSTEYKKS